jgi:tetratricopeptide (TPR) repeat protein
LAGDQSVQSGAYKEAIKFYGQVLTLSAGTMTLFQVASTEYQLGMAYYGLSNLESSRTHMLHALALLGWTVPTAPNKIIEALLQEFALQIIRPARIFERYTSYPRDVLLLVARICAHLTQIGFFTGSVMSSALFTFRSVNFAEAAGVSPELARSYAHMALGLGLIPLDILAQHYSRQSLIVAKAANQTATLAYSLYITGFYQSTVGNWTQATATIEQAVTILESIGDKRRFREALANLGYMFGLQGKFAESYQVRLRLEQEAERGHGASRAWARWRCGWAALMKRSAYCTPASISWISLPTQ